jgi:hypothetical protein
MPAFSRYLRDRVSSDGKGLATSGAIAVIRSAIQTGDVPIVKTLTTTQADRLDSLAAALYNDSRYWWVLAAASNIGWGLQVPPGTVILVPDIKSVEGLVA